MNAATCNMEHPETASVEFIDGNKTLSRYESAIERIFKELNSSLKSSIAQQHIEY